MVDGSGSTFDRLFRALADQRRRYILYSLQLASSETVTLEELVTHVANWETEPGTPLTEDHREELTIALQHHHLPKLEDYGMIDYDPRTEMICYQDEIAKQDWLEQVKAEELTEE